MKRIVYERVVRVVEVVERVIVMDDEEATEQALTPLVIELPAPRERIESSRSVEAA